MCFSNRRNVVPGIRVVSARNDNGRNYDRIFWNRTFDFLGNKRRSLLSYFMGKKTTEEAEPVT